MIVVRHYGRGEFGFDCPTYSPMLRQLAKETPGCRWESSARAWAGYADAIAAVSIRLKEKGMFLNDDALPAADVDPPTTMLVATKGLRNYQIEGVRFLTAHAEEGALLADEMGLGKTPTAIRAVRAFKGRTVVVCPAFVKGTWVDELPKWWPGVKFEVLKGTKPYSLQPGVDIVIVNYDVLHAWMSVLLAWKLTDIVFDECHYLMGEKSRRSNAARPLARAANRRYGLSGTPMLSRPRDLWNVLDTLSEGRMGKPFSFYLRYCGAKRVQVTRDKLVWDFSGSSNLDELKARMRYFMLRRTKSDVSLELPSRTRQILDVDVPKGNLIAPAVALTNDAMLQKALDMAADGKIGHVVALVESHLMGGHKVIVFTHRRVMAETICNQLVAGGVDAVYIHGGQPATSRAETIKAQHDVIIATLDSVKEGINTLTYCDVGVFAELDWVPSKLAQGEARLHRSGQKNKVLIQYVVALGSVDEIIRKACLEKLAAFEDGVGKLDDKLRDDFLSAKKEQGAKGLKSLYDRIVAAEAAKKAKL